MAEIALKVYIGSVASFGQHLDDLLRCKGIVDLKYGCDATAVWRFVQIAAPRYFDTLPGEQDQTKE